MAIFFSSDYHLDHSNIIKYDGRPDVNIEVMNNRIIDTTNEYVKEKDIFIYQGDFCLPKDIRREDNNGYVERIKFHLDKLKCKNIIFVCGNHDRTYVEHQGSFIPNFSLWNLFTSYHCVLCGNIFDKEGRFNLPKRCSKDCVGMFEKLYQNTIYNIHPMGYELRLTKKICAEQDIPRTFEGMLITCTHYSHRVFNKSHKPKDENIGKSICLYGHSHGHLEGIRNSFDVGFNIWNRPLSLVEILTYLMPKHNAKNPPYIPHHER